MAQTLIKVKCTDQILEVVEAPIIASGGYNEDKVVFEFCPLWNGFTKTATFYVKKGEAYYAELDSDNTCIIPHEVLEKVGNMFFGVVGVNANGITRTSEVIKYKIVQGAISEDHKPSDPTPDIYEQILAKMNSVQKSAEAAAKSAEDAAISAEETKIAAEEVKEVTIEANKATNDAKSATSEALKATEDANAATKNANAAATSVTEATQRANTAADNADKATAEAKAATKECKDLVADVEKKLEDGEFTPKVGEDFFTPKEKQEMVNDILASLPRDITVTSWKAVQEVVRAGKAAEVFSIGDQIECQHTVYGTLLWDVIGIDHDIPVDSQYEHSITLQLHDVLPEKFLFDAPEPNSPYTHHQRYGSNMWRESAIRQWLNSDGTAGNWWNAQTDWDVAPGYATTHNAFLHGLDDDFLAVIGAVSKTSALNDEEPEDLSVTEDKFFLLSKTEVYWGANHGVEEGVVYPYYSLFSDLESPSYTEDTNRIKYRQGEACQWMLRSIMQDFSSTTRDVRAIRATGNFHHHGGYNSDGIAPACCIY